MTQLHLGAMNQHAEDKEQEKAAYKPKMLRASLSWNALFKRLSLKAEDVAKIAHLPPTIFKQASPKLLPEQTVRIWKAVEKLHKDGQHIGLEFARPSLKNSVNLAICALLFSKDLANAIKNLNDFQPLMMPTHYRYEDHRYEDHRYEDRHAENNQEQTTIHVTLDIAQQDLPRSLSYFILVMLVELVRASTGEQTIPSSVVLNNGGERDPRYTDYFGVEPLNSNRLSITFKREDMKKPFLLGNEKTWQFFAPLLKRRAELSGQSPRYTSQVKGYLFEKLSSGQSDIKSVSEHFSMTSRTLQRRLFEEGTSFRKILDETRSEMAFVYLSNTDFAAYEISFLLGFEDKNSFFRAFHRWTGTTPQAARASLDGRKNYLA